MFDATDAPQLSREHDGTAGRHRGQPATAQPLEKVALAVAKAVAQAHHRLVQSPITRGVVKLRPSEPNLRDHTCRWSGSSLGADSRNTTQVPGRSERVTNQIIYYLN